MVNLKGTTEAEKKGKVSEEKIFKNGSFVPVSEFSSVVHWKTVGNIWYGRYAQMNQMLKYSLAKTQNAKSLREYIKKLEKHLYLI